MTAPLIDPSASFVDLLLDAVCVVDLNGKFVYVSAAFERIFGYRPDEVIGQQMLDLVLPEDRERTLAAARAVISGYAQLGFENRYLRKDGQVVHIMWSARWSEADQLRIAVARDITERKHAEKLQSALFSISEAAHSAQDVLALYQQIQRIIAGLIPLQSFSVALCTGPEQSSMLSFPYVIDDHERVAEVSPFTRRLSEYVVPMGQPLLVNSATAGALPAEILALQADDRHSWLAVPLVSNTGTIGALVLKGFADGASYTERDTELLRFVSTQIATAIERKKLQEQLQHSAHYDELTGLPKRGLFFDRLHLALTRARRGHERMSLLFIDLNKFKQVNDSFGHGVGDQLLKIVAARLTACLRDSDTVARIGGDEFVLLIENVELTEHATTVAQKIRDALALPMQIDELVLQIIPSIGIAHYPENGDSETLLLKYADAAMYADKKQLQV